ncbi:MAG: chemotaxis protein CheW [Pseudomonadota bacterium]
MSQSAFERLHELAELASARSTGLPRRDAVVSHWTALAYRLGEETFVSPLEQVTEILPLPQLTRLPLAQPWVLGIANLRGELTPVFDLLGVCGRGAVSQDARARVLVARLESWPLGLLVSESLGLRHFQVDARRPVVQAPAGLEGYVTEEVAEPWRSWMILDLRRLLQGAEVLRASR